MHSFGFVGGVVLKQLTIRGVGMNLHKSIKEEARRRGLSINRYVLLVLQEAVGFGSIDENPETSFHDLDHLAGTWTQKEFEEFEKQLVTQRSIEQELWQ